MKITAGLVVAAIAITSVHAGNSIMEKGESADTSCPGACLAVMRPVYDEDGTRYSNECYMRAAKCKGEKKNGNILEEYKEEGDNSTDAPTFVKGTKQASADESAEDSTDGSDESYCEDVMCPAVYSPVTDENGTVYPNECAMNAAKNCKGKKKKSVNILEEYKRLYGRSFGASRPDDAGDDASKLVKSSKGSSKAAKKSAADSTDIGRLYDDGADGVIGSESDDVSPSKKCASACPDVELYVCGSDGIRYSNPCELKIAACKNPDLEIVEVEVYLCSTDETASKKSKTGKIGLH